MNEADAIHRDEIKYTTRSLKRNTTLGPDGITNEVLKCYTRYQTDFLLKVYNKCLSEGHFPLSWKTARLVLLRKGDKPLEQSSSYRPLCNLDCPGKLLEKILDNRLRKHLEENNGLDDRQYGFRKGRSTTNAVYTLRTIVTNSGPKKKIGVLSLDVKNAFNSAPWEAIMGALQDKNVPSYLRHIIGSYLDNRTLLVSSGGNTKKVPLSIGVPQGSVIGPTLWNIHYDGLLKISLPTGVSFLAFADDVALVASAKDTVALSNLLSEAAEAVSNWLTNTGLQLATQKSEALVITNTRTHNEMIVYINGEEIAAGKTIKYLGLEIDAKLRFTNHVKGAAIKANKVAQNISRIMLNLSLAKPTKRRLIGGVVQSILLYGAPNWSDRISKKGISEISRVQRKTALRIATAYSTVSTDAALVLADLPPIELLAEERRCNYLAKRAIDGHHSNTNARKQVLNTWQTRWDISSKGRWTHRLIQNIEQWFTRKHGEVSFHLTQAFSGHGCFSSYLNSIGKAPSPACWYCDDPTDDALHTVFKCDAWFHSRRRLEINLGEEIHPESIVSVMLKSEGNWLAIRDFIKSILTKKEEEERRRQML